MQRYEPGDIVRMKKRHPCGITAFYLWKLHLLAGGSRFRRGP